MKLTNMKYKMLALFLLSMPAWVMPGVDKAQVATIAIDETHLPEFHQYALKLLIACFDQVNEFRQPVTDFIHEVCKVIKDNRGYFIKKYPTINIDKCVVDLRSIKPNQSIMVVKNTLSPYWNLLPIKLKDLGVIKFAINARKRLAIS